MQLRYRSAAILFILAMSISTIWAVELLPEERRVVDEVLTTCESIVGESTLLESSPIVFREQNIGERYLFQFEDRFDVRLDHVHPDNQPERFVGEVSTPTSALRLAPKIFLGMDQSCAIQQVRYLRYQNDVAIDLTILGPSMEEIGSELLNPPLSKNSSISNDKNVLVALIDSGVNYLLPEIRAGLARNASGNMLGYDFWDLDDRPFDVQTPGSPFFIQRHGTRTASILLREAPATRLVSYRYPRPDLSRMKALIAHADSLGVRIIGMPLGSGKKEDWAVFAQTAAAHPHILFIVSAGNNGVDIDRTPVYPASMAIENMLVVTSSDDFQRPAERTNWGAGSVHYMTPAESVQALDFTGIDRAVSGSSYAVSRVAALASNLLSERTTMTTEELRDSIERRALAPGKGRYVRNGYIPDPRSVTADMTFRFAESSSREGSIDSSGESPLGFNISALVLDHRWQLPDVQLAMENANQILSVCGIVIQNTELFTVESDDYLKDLSTGTAHTVLSRFDQLRPDSEKQSQVVVVFARDSKMQQPFEAEAFGEGNTRSRRWLENSLWVTYGARDLGITLAHELFHILSNDGRHTTEAGNLMTAETSGDNVALSEFQCSAARKFFN